jgi:predicted 3-demethylubiquinone-9 3-methyltransferase (glyoxalase superfamily)
LGRVSRKAGGVHRLTALEDNGDFEKGPAILKTVAEGSAVPDGVDTANPDGTEAKRPYRTGGVPMNKITPFLWFADQAEEAANFYVSVFRNSKINRVTHYSPDGAEASGRPRGSVMTVEFVLDGQPFVALNGGPHFHFSEAISFVVNCDTQKEVDNFWEKLTAGGEAGQCGWLKDKYGVSWQIVPSALGELLSGPDAAASQRVMKALLQMTKLDTAVLRRAHANSELVTDEA